MLHLKIPLGPELWDPVTEEFIEPKVQVLCLEHSLVSLAKWESKWGKVFLSKQEKTYEESVDYIRCMTLTQNVNPEVYNHLTNNHIRQINEYIEAPMTATTFSDKGGKKSREVVTAEIIYYWMVALNIPFECQKWHLNRLLTLIKVCNVKNSPKKKRSVIDTMQQHMALNEARRKALNSKG